MRESFLPPFQGYSTHLPATGGRAASRLAPGYCLLAPPGQEPIRFKTAGRIANSGAFNGIYPALSLGGSIGIEADCAPDACAMQILCGIGLKPVPTGGKFVYSS